MRHLASWNERVPARRRALADGLWTEDAGHVGPIVAAEGRDAVEDVMATAQRRFPGLVHRLSGNADGHHGVARPT
ncbi:hypothetical protein [Streptomyces sp. NPDC000351]|uniref:hypothetical protein n=1 Tax=Streptomyces sp. NPDC000351 TaxID=3154250 RepID=UPI0033184746